MYIIVKFRFLLYKKKMKGLKQSFQALAIGFLQDSRPLIQCTWTYHSMMHDFVNAEHKHKKEFNFMLEIIYNRNFNSKATLRQMLVKSMRQKLNYVHLQVDIRYTLHNRFRLFPFWFGNRTIWALITQYFTPN